MDLLEVLRVTVHRWYILLPLLLLSFAGASMVSQQVKPVYELEGILTINAPYATTEEEVVLLSANRFLDYVNTALIISAIAESAEVRNIMKTAGSDHNYDVQVRFNVVQVGITESNPEQALTTYRRLIEVLDVRLDNLQEQAAIPPHRRVTVADGLQPQGALESLGNRQRVLLASAALGTIISIAICVFADYLLARRN